MCTSSSPGRSGASLTSRRPYPASSSERSISRRAEAQGGVRHEGLAAAREPVGPSERHEGEGHLGQVHPALDGAETPDVDDAQRLLARPRAPALALGVADLEHQVPADSQRISRAPSNVARHASSVRKTWATLPVIVAMSTCSGGSVVASPSRHVTPFGVRLAARQVERRLGGIDPHHLAAARRQAVGEGARTAPDVEHRAGPELMDERLVVVEVAPVFVEVVVELSQPRVGEDRVGHGPSQVGPRM